MTGRGRNLLLNLLALYCLYGMPRHLMPPAKMEKLRLHSSTSQTPLLRWCVLRSVQSFLSFADCLPIDRNTSHWISRRPATTKRTQHFDCRKESLFVSFQFPTLPYAMDCCHQASYVREFYAPGSIHRLLDCW